MSYNTGVCRARYKIVSGLNHDISYLKSSISRARIHSCAADTNYTCIQSELSAWWSMVMENKNRLLSVDFSVSDLLWRASRWLFSYWKYEPRKWITSRARICQRVQVLFQGILELTPVLSCNTTEWHRCALILSSWQWSRTILRSR